jgi:hypothetical protein
MTSMTSLYVKIGAAIALLAAIFFGGYHLGGLKGQADVSRLQRDQAQSLAAAYSAREAERQAKESAYETEIAQLKTDSLQFPTVAVRMCPPTPVVSASGKAGQVLPPSGGVGQGDPKPVPQSERPDYGPSLFGLADALDSIAARCR